MSALLSRARYRLAQLRWSLHARLGETDRAWVARTLTPAELALFTRMPSFDQTHSVLVAREVEREGGDGVLIRAALLHDCGKTVPPHQVPLLYRGGLVLLRALSPRLMRALARPWGLLWPIYLHVHHPELGAEQLEKVGSPREVTELVRAHQRPAADPALLRLQRADARH